MATRLYEIKFKVKGRGNTVFTWLQWHKSRDVAKQYADKAIEEEYPQGHKIVSVRLSKQAIHEFSARR